MLRLTARRVLPPRAAPSLRFQSTQPPPLPRPEPLAPLPPPAASAPPILPAPGQGAAAAPQPSRAVPEPPREPPAPPAPSAHSGPGVGKRLRSLLLSSALFLGTGAFLAYAYDSRAGVHRWLVQPAFMALTKDDPELAHEIAVKLLAQNVGPMDCGVDDERLAFELWGKKFDNPIGVAAGFDKHAQAIDGLFNLGFGYVEVGSITPEPQAGNPKPRVFRVPELQSVVNRYGFNSDGHAAALARFRQRIIGFVSSYANLLPPSLFPAAPQTQAAIEEFDPVRAYLASPQGAGAAPADAVGLPRSLTPGKVLGINLGKNKVSDPDSIDDFVKGIASLGPYADVLVVNVSSPNTPGLRNLQRKGMLSELLEGVVQARDLLPTAVKPPVLVKVAPDLDDEQVSDIAYAARTSGVDGVIVSNTTISRPASAGSSPVLQETGGLSGPPVKALALRALAALYDQTDGKIPLVGCGGISSGQDALDYAKAGASLVQLYTGFVYGGVGLPRRIKDELTELLKKEGKAWKDVVGSGRVKAVPPPPAPAVAVSSLADGLSEKPAAPPATEEDFAKGLSDAKAELESLLKELTQVEKVPVAGESAEAPVAAAVPAGAPAPAVAVPAPVAESLPASAADPLVVPAPASAPSADTAPAPEPAPSPSSAAAPEPRIVATAPAPKIDDSPLAVPAQAILDDKALAELLSPAAAQVAAGVAPSPAKEAKDEVPEPKKADEKRWV
ncbi:Dihydroorotate dehydrogenase (quinone), mitochondrial [Rhodotorula kratochvilovae]